MSITSVNQRRTGELVDQVAHEAGIIDKDHHVTGNANAKSGTQLHHERNGEGTPAEVAKSVAWDVARDVGAEVFEHRLSSSAAGQVVAGGAFLYGTFELARICLKELSKAEAKGEEIRAAFDNDAVTVAVAKSLDFDPRFGGTEEASRPGVTIASRKFSTKLDEHADMKVVLQSRADEGFIAAQRARAAVKNLPPSEQAAARAKWMNDNGFAERMSSDVAFGLGVRYAEWIASEPARKVGVRPEDEAKKVETRRPPEPPAVQVRG